MARATREVVSVRFTAEEQEQLQRLADVSGISKSDVIRVLVKRAARNAEKFSESLV